MLELNFSARDTAFWSAIQVCLGYYSVRSSIDSNHKREDFLCSLFIFRDLLYVVKIMFTTYLCFLSDVLSTRFLVFISTPSCAQT